MNLLFAVVLIIAGISNCFAVDYTQDADCLGSWLINEGEGTTIGDSTASNTGTFKGAGEPAWYDTVLPAAYTSWSIFFDGSNDYSNFASSLDADTDKLSIVCWLYYDSVNTTVHMVSQHNDFAIAGGSGNHTVRMLINNSWSGEYSVSSSAWVHVAGVYDGVDMTIFVDGVEQASPTAKTGTLTTGDNFLLGNYTGGGYAFHGKIAEVAVFKRALSDAEVNDIMDNGLEGGAAAPAASEDAIPVIIITGD